MSMFQKNDSAQNLSEWLEIATKELVVPAERRIWAEVTSHYEEAVEAHLQNGLPIALAQAAALAELGDAKAAGRRFRRTHLTVLEFEKVHGLLKSCQPSLWVECGGVCLCLSFGMALGLRPLSISTLVGMVALFIVYETVVRRLARNKSSRRVVQMDPGGLVIVWNFLSLCVLPSSACLAFHLCASVCSGRACKHPVSLPTQQQTGKSGRRLDGRSRRSPERDSARQAHGLLMPWNKPFRNSPQANASAASRNRRN